MVGGMREGDRMVGGKTHTWEPGMTHILEPGMTRTLVLDMLVVHNHSLFPLFRLRRLPLPLLRLRGEHPQHMFSTQPARP